MQLKLTKPRQRWFFLIALPSAIAIEFAFAATLDWSAYPRSEWVALVDLCVFMPLIYLLFFASELPAKTRAIRAAGVAGLGLFAASFIVPQPHQFITAELSNLRNAMLVVIVLFEGWVMWKVIGALYRRNADAKTLERDFAMPEWVAKLMVLEAKFWKSVWTLLRGK